MGASELINDLKIKADAGTYNTDKLLTLLLNMDRTSKLKFFLLKLNAICDNAHQPVLLVHMQ